MREQESERVKIEKNNSLPATLRSIDIKESESLQPNSEQSVLSPHTSLFSKEALKKLRQLELALVVPKQNIELIKQLMQELSANQFCLPEEVKEKLIDEAGKIMQFEILLKRLVKELDKLFPSSPDNKQRQVVSNFQPVLSLNLEGIRNIRAFIYCLTSGPKNIFDKLEEADLLIAKYRGYYLSQDYLIYFSSYQKVRMMCQVLSEVETIKLINQDKVERLITSLIYSIIENKEVVDLSALDLNNKAARIVLKLLEKYHPVLSGLRLSNNNLTEFPAVDGFRSLRKLDLSGNRISYVEGVFLVKQLQCLQELNLSGNPIKLNYKSVSVNTFGLRLILNDVDDSIAFQSEVQKLSAIFSNIETNNKALNKILSGKSSAEKSADGTGRLNTNESADIDSILEQNSNKEHRWGFSLIKTLPFKWVFLSGQKEEHCDSNKASVHQNKQVPSKAPAFPAANQMGAGNNTKQKI